MFCRCGQHALNSLHEGWTTAPRWELDSTQLTCDRSGLIAMLTVSPRPEKWACQRPCSGENGVPIKHRDLGWEIRLSTLSTAFGVGFGKCEKGFWPVHKDIRSQNALCEAYQFQTEVEIAHSCTWFTINLKLHFCNVAKQMIFFF